MFQCLFKEKIQEPVVKKNNNKLFYTGIAIVGAGICISCIMKKKKCCKMHEENDNEREHISLKEKENDMVDEIVDKYDLDDEMKYIKEDLSLDHIEKDIKKVVKEVGNNINIDGLEDVKNALKIEDKIDEFNSNRLNYDNEKHMDKNEVDNKVNNIKQDKSSREIDSELYKEEKYDNYDYDNK